MPSRFGLTQCVEHAGRPLQRGGVGQHGARVAHLVRIDDRQTGYASVTGACADLIPHTLAVAAERVRPPGASGPVEVGGRSALPAGRDPTRAGEDHATAHPGARWRARHRRRDDPRTRRTGPGNRHGLRGARHSEHPGRRVRGRPARDRQLRSPRPTKARWSSRPGATRSPCSRPTPPTAPARRCCPPTPTLPAGGNVTLVAHLSESGQPTITPFVNDVSSVPAGQARLVVRHTAAAPAVDVLAGDTPVIQRPDQPEREGPGGARRHGRQPRSPRPAPPSR